MYYRKKLIEHANVNNRMREVEGYEFENKDDLK